MATLRGLGYKVSDWGSKGLDDYCSWMETEFEGMQFKESFTILKTHKIGLDILRMPLNPSDEAVKWGIPNGDAFRIINSCNTWIEQRESEMKG